MYFRPQNRYCLDTWSLRISATVRWWGGSGHLLERAARRGTSKDHIKARIPHSGSKAHYRGDIRNHCGRIVMLMCFGLLTKEVLRTTTGFQLVRAGRAGGHAGTKHPWQDRWGFPTIRGQIFVVKTPTNRTPNL